MKHWQCLFIALALLTAAAAFAVPTFTPTLDGVKDAEWGVVPDEGSSSIAAPTEFNLDGGLYVTDDSQFIYFGFDADPDPSADGTSPHIHILIDVGSTATGGSTAAWGAGFVQYNMAYRPEFDLVTQWNTDDQNIQFTGLNEWTGSWNQLPEILTDAGGGGFYTEIAIDRLDLGDPEIGSTINLTMWLRPSWGVSGGNCVLPEEAGFPSANGATAHPITVQFPYTVQTAYGDPTPPCLFDVRQIDTISVELVFNEDMDQTTLNVPGNYTMTDWFQTGFLYVTATTVGFWNNSGFVAGNTYSVQVGSGITDVAGNPIDPDCDELSWEAPGYATVTFLVHDPGAGEDTLEIRGSYDFYHEYDASWPGPAHRLYDDGTHGDVSAGDHTHSLELALIPNGGTPNFEWKYLTNEGQWQPDPNNSFSLPDLNPVTVEYTIPNPILQDVTVTFSIDVSCAQLCFDSVTIAGTFNGWSGSTALTDEGSGIYSMDVLFLAGASGLQEYKYRYHYTTDIDTPTVWENISNRVLLIDDSAPTQVLPTVFWEDNSCTQLTQDVTVTFYADLQCIFAPIDSMTLVGSFTCWGTNPITMTSLGNGQYSAAVLFEAGDPVHQEFKFRRHDGETVDWESVGNRVLDIDEGFPTMELGNLFFNDWLCPPIDLTAMRIDDTTLRLRWLGPQRAVFQVWEHTLPDAVSVNGLLLDTVSDQFYDITLPIEPIGGLFYQVVAVAE